MSAVLGEQNSGGWKEEEAVLAGGFSPSSASCHGGGVGGGGGEWFSQQPGGDWDWDWGRWVEVAEGHTREAPSQGARPPAGAPRWVCPEQLSPEALASP